MHRRIRMLTVAVLAVAVLAVAPGCASSPPEPIPLPRPSTLLPALLAAGLDLDNLPDSPRLLGDNLRGRVMDSFTASLGNDCGDCHAGLEYAKPTDEKTLTLGMWQHFIKQLTLADGQPLWCDSCHQGRQEFLDRRSEDELAAWMNENYVGQLARKDGAAHSCASCHGDPFEAEIFATWRQELAVGG